MKFKILLICSIISVCCLFAYSEEKTILYVTDNIHLSNSFDTKYVDMLQTFIDDEYGKNQINVQKISRFDINTTECLEFLKVFNQRHLPQAVIIMIGEANYHNLYGFSSYIQDRDKHKSKKIAVPNTFQNINKEMAIIYGIRNPDIFTVAYKVMLKNNKKGFKPKVIPHFYALNKNFTIDNNVMALMETYRHVWNLIKEKEFNKAKKFLNITLEKKPSQSMLYYALGSFYLIEKKEHAEEKALRAFEDGILVDPLDKENLCYKGLMLLFMMYKGEITAEVLHFAKSLNSCVLNISDEISAITTINTPKYDEKTQVIDSWILYDIERIRQMCRENKVDLIFAGYPADVKINKVVENYIGKYGTMFFINNKVNDDDINFMIYRLAKNMYAFLKNNKIIK